MKRIIHILLLIASFLTVLNTGNEAVAQRYASESYNPYSPWNQAGDGDYWMRRCAICDVFVSGRSEEELEENMSDHMLIHIEDSGWFDPWSSGEDYNGGNISSPEEDLNVKDAFVVNAYEVAYALARMRVYNADHFIDDCISKYDNASLSNLSLSDIENCLVQYINPYVGEMTFWQAFNSFYPVLVLANPELSYTATTPSGTIRYYKYKVITKDEISGYNTLNRLHYYVLRRW